MTRSQKAEPAAKIPAFRGSLRPERRGRAAVLARRLLVPLAGLLVASGCANHGPSTLIGVRKVSLSVAFKDDALTPPKVPKVVVNVLAPAPPVPVGSFTLAPPPAVPALPTIPVPQLCPAAPPGATPDEPATVAITRTPKEGTYYKRNDGTVKVTGGVVPLTFPYPPISQVTVSHVSTTVVTSPYYGDEPVTTYEVDDQLAPTLSVRSTYSYNPRELDLVKEEVISDGQITSFNPTPSIEALPFTGPGATWASAGIDTSNRTGETLQGSIDGARQVIDVCGKLVDTLKVSTTENRASVSDGSTSGSGNPDHPNVPIVQNYALQLGGLVVRREEHSQRTLQTSSAPITLQIDVVSTLLSVTPSGPVLP